MKSNITGGLSAIAAILFSFLSSNVLGQDTDYGKTGYHPETPRLALTYACLDKNGDIEGFYTMKLLQTENIDDQEILHYFQQFYKPDGKPILKKTGLPLRVTICQGKPTWTHLKGWTRAIKTMNMVAKGDINTLPDSLHIQTSIPESEIKIRLDNIGASLHTFDREVKDHQKITTMAGEFDAYYMTETQEMHAIITIEENIETWYARGIGAIRQRIFNKKGEPIRGMELVDVQIAGADEIPDIEQIIEHVSILSRTDNN